MFAASCTKVEEMNCMSKFQYKRCKPTHLATAQQTTVPIHLVSSWAQPNGKRQRKKNKNESHCQI